MKNLTRSELEAIGQNLLNRRKKLLAYAQKIETPMERSFRAWDLAHTLDLAIARIVIVLAQPKAPKGFPSGGVASSIETMKPGEYVIARPKFKK